jgi:hypothetical protein
LKFSPLNESQLDGEEGETGSNAYFREMKKNERLNNNEQSRIQSLDNSGITKRNTFSERPKSIFSLINYLDESKAFDVSESQSEVSQKDKEESKEDTQAGKSVFGSYNIMSA